MASYRGQFSQDGESISYGEPLGSTADLMQFNRLCAGAFPPRNKTKEARIQSEMSWAPVREWLGSHSLEEVREAALQRGDSNMTALHFACRNGSLIDVIDVILSVANETVQWPDSFGWLPIHYACACGAETAVIKKLAEEFPESKTTVDRRGRTPLHFALGNQNPDQLATPAVVAILSSTGAASFADEHGMLVSYLELVGTKKAAHILVLMMLCPSFIAAPPLCVCLWSIRGGLVRPHGCL